MITTFFLDTEEEVISYIFQVPIEMIDIDIILQEHILEVRQIKRFFFHSITDLVPESRKKITKEQMFLNITKLNLPQKLYLFYISIKDLHINLIDHCLSIPEFITKEIQHLCSEALSVSLLRSYHNNEYENLNYNNKSFMYSKQSFMYYYFNNEILYNNLSIYVCIHDLNSMAKYYMNKKDKKIIRCIHNTFQRLLTKSKLDSLALKELEESKYLHRFIDLSHYKWRDCIFPYYYSNVLNQSNFPYLYKKCQKEISKIKNITECIKINSEIPTDCINYIIEPYL